MLRHRMHAGVVHTDVGSGLTAQVSEPQTTAKVTEPHQDHREAQNLNRFLTQHGPSCSVFQ